jgi:endonuclease G
MKIVVYIVYLFLLIQSSVYGQDDTPSKQNKRISELELPLYTKKEMVISHTGFTLSYNEKHEQANWVAYQLTKEETDKIFKRTNKFLQDPKVRTGSATDEDYKNSGYDRGHLAPAADMGWSAETMAESFYYSNMSPQTPAFNRGIWKKLEELVRDWAIENEDIYVVTGPVLKNDLKTIGVNHVSVPEYYYKVILDYTKPEIKGIGFLLPNEESKKEVYNFAVSIDSVESFTGIDFFPRLPDEEEKKIEKSICLSCWVWEDVKNEKHTESTPSSSTLQCKGITKAGNRCENNTSNKSGYCHHHIGQYKDE